MEEVLAQPRPSVDARVVVEANLLPRAFLEHLAPLLVLRRFAVERGEADPRVELGVLVHTKSILITKHLSTMPQGRARFNRRRHSASAEPRS